MKNTPSEFNLSDHLNIVAKALDVLGIFALGYLVYAFYHDNFLLPDYYSTALVLSSIKATASNPDS